MKPFLRVLLAAVVGASCGGAPAPAPAPVPKKPSSAPVQEHVVELEAKTELSKADAEAQMAERCGPGKYTIVRDGEEIVLKETVYRIHYRCN